MGEKEMSDEKVEAKRVAMGMKMNEIRTKINR